MQAFILNKVAVCLRSCIIDLGVSYINSCKGDTLGLAVSCVKVIGDGVSRLSTTLEK